MKLPKHAAEAKILSFPFKVPILPVTNDKYIESQLSQVPEDLYSYIFIFVLLFILQKGPPLM